LPPVARRCSCSPPPPKIFENSPSWLPRQHPSASPQPKNRVQDGIDRVNDFMSAEFFNDIRQKRPFTQSPHSYGQTIKNKGHAGITPHGLCETVPQALQRFRLGAHSVRVEVPV